MKNEKQKHENKSTFVGNIEYISRVGIPSGTEGTTTKLIGIRKKQRNINWTYMVMLLYVRSMVILLLPNGTVYVYNVEIVKACKY